MRNKILSMMRKTIKKITKSRNVLSMPCIISYHLTYISLTNKCICKKDSFALTFLQDRHNSS